MNIIKWRQYDPFRELWNIQGEMNKLFNKSLSKDAEQSFTPALDIHEEKDKYVVKADLPGMKQEDIGIDLNEDVLTIKGEKKHELEDKSKSFHRVERFYGTFERSIVLPSNIEAEKIDASYRNGVLEVVLPKTERESKKTRKIDIK